MSRRPNAPLGRTQQLVLQLLANDSKSIRHLSYDWPGLTESAARSAVERLAQRSLVDLAGTDQYGARTYCLTAHGVEVERAVSNLDDDE